MFLISTSISVCPIITTMHSWNNVFFFRSNKYQVRGMFGLPVSLFYRRKNHHVDAILIWTPLNNSVLPILFRVFINIEQCCYTRFSFNNIAQWIEVNLFTATRYIILHNYRYPEGDSSKGFAIVPYIQEVAEPIQRVLNNCGIKVALKPFQTLRHIFAKPKDRVATKQKTHVVYSIPCGDCEKEYLGETKRQFGTRLKEHQEAVSILDGSKSALGQGVIDKGVVWKPGISMRVFCPV